MQMGQMACVLVHTVEGGFYGWFCNMYLVTHLVYVYIITQKNIYIMIIHVSPLRSRQEIPAQGICGESKMEQKRGISSITN